VFSTVLSTVLALCIKHYFTLFIIGKKKCIFVAFSELEKDFFFCFLYNKPHPRYIQLATPTRALLPLAYSVHNIRKKPNLIHPIAYFLCPILFLHHQKGYQMQDPLEARFLTFPNSLRSLFLSYKTRGRIGKAQVRAGFCASLSEDDNKDSNQIYKMGYANEMPFHF